MELSDFAIKELVPLVIGDSDGLFTYRKGSELVALFNKYGTRDVYEFNNRGLPKLSGKSSASPSRTQYAKDRLRGLSGTNFLRALLEEVLNESQNK